MRESSTYQAILEEGAAIGEARGRLAEAGRDLLDLGTEKLGPPEARTIDTVESVADLELLRRLFRRTLWASSWDELRAELDDR